MRPDLGSRRYNDLRCSIGVQTACPFTQLQGRIRATKRGEQHAPASGGMPGLGHAGREERAVRNARFAARAVLAVHDHDFARALFKEVRGGEADDALPIATIFMASGAAGAPHLR